MNSHTVTMNPPGIPASRAELSDFDLVAHVSSEDPDKRQWTELSIYHRDHTERPFVAVVEMIESGESGRNPVPIAFRARRFGTIDGAIGYFDDTKLTDALVAAIPTDVEGRYPDANTLRQRAAVEARKARAYQGDGSLTDIVRWLYGDGLSDNAAGGNLERDFGIGQRTARAQLKAERDGLDSGGAWLKPFAAALRYFDRKAWEGERT